MVHQPLDATAAHRAALSLQLDMDTRAAITSVDVAMDPLDVVSEVTISGGSPAIRARAPGIIAGRRDTEQVAHDCHGVFSAAIFDERNLMSELQQKSRSTFFKMSRPCATARSPVADGQAPRTYPPTAAPPALWGRSSLMSFRPTPPDCSSPSVHQFGGGS